MVAAHARAPFAGRTIARIRGASGLLALALLGRGLWELGAMAPEAAQMEDSAEPDGSSLTIMAEGPGLGGSMDYRVVLARTPIEIDEVLSVARVHGTGPRVIPRGSGTVLVSTDGSIALEPLLPAPVLRSLIQAPRSQRPALLRKLLAGDPSLERVRRFWD
jgi:hypothetical protein